jgi:trehalose synthase
VVAGNVGGIPLQVEDGVSGFLIDGVEECAQRVTQLLQQPELAERMGKAGHAHVREHFLITRYMRDYLRIFVDQKNGDAGTRFAIRRNLEKVAEAVPGVGLPS